MLPAAAATLAAFAALAAEKPAKFGHFGDLTVTGEKVTANRKTGEMSITGSVTAVSGVYRFMSDSVVRTPDGFIDFGENTTFTTCTNELDELHWKLTGHYRYLPEKEIHVRNAWLYFEDIPVMWVPYWYYPMNTDYGWRFMPGYTSRWGAYFLSGYVYNIVNEDKAGAYALGGSTYLDMRTKNGVAVGQTVRWHLNDFGYGKFKVYHAWDRDHDRYSRHWDDSRYNYLNWGSEVEHRRYRLMFEHEADPTERDSFRLRASYLSDSHFLHDFLERDERKESIPVNEAWYEHRENDFATGASVSGPLNDFYPGTARTPEGWFAVNPQPVFALPVNYESQTRAGYYNREFGSMGATDPMYHYNPYLGLNGKGADYQAFRADTHHRVSVPFKLLDVLAVNPRASYRGTYWSDSGSAGSMYTAASGNDIYRNIGEAGVTFSARATGWLNERWQHVFEPYVDYSYQEVELSGGKDNRYYVFDSYDRSVEWLDQFGFEGRGLPFNWHGVRPGIRNLLRRKDDKGVLSSIVDADVYAAIPFNDESRYESARRDEDDDEVSRDYALRGYPRDDRHGSYSRRECIVPGTRLRLHPYRNMTLQSRIEYDCDESAVAYADIMFRHRITEEFSWYVSYLGRDHRIWDYLPSEYDRWNYELSNQLQVGFEHQVCDWLAWSPFVRADCRRDRLDEYGAWVDFLTDCLGFRFQAAHVTSFERVDHSKFESDNRFSFFVYLRSLGPGSMLDLAKF